MFHNCVVVYSRNNEVKMSNDINSIRLPSTIAAIVLISCLCTVPLILYLRIVLKFVCDRNLQRELEGKGGNGFDTGTPVSVLQPPEILLSFKDVTYTVTKTQAKILKGVTGYFAPRSLTAILGTSGKILAIPAKFVTNISSTKI